MIVFTSGCTLTEPGNNPGSATVITSPPATMATTLTTVPTTIPVPPKDPIIGTWVGYKYLASGRIQLVWTIMENNTWSLVNTNMKSQHKKFVYGKWKKDSAVTYQITPPSGTWITCTYDPAKDEWSDTFFLVTFTRVTDPDTLIPEQIRTMNITLYSAQMVSEINGSHPFSGNKYLIVNISIKNINETGGYSFTDDKIWVVLEDQNGLTAINQKLKGKVENPFPSIKIGPGEAQQGMVIFGVPEKPQSYVLRLIDSNGYVISNDVELKNL